MHIHIYICIYILRYLAICWFQTKLQITGFVMIGHFCLFIECITSFRWLQMCWSPATSMSFPLRLKHSAVDITWCWFRLDPFNKWQGVDSPLFYYSWHTSYLMALMLNTCSLQWCHKEHDDVWNHRCIDCLLKSLFSSESLAFVRRMYQWPVYSLHKGPITRKMFSIDDFIMECEQLCKSCCF